MIEIYWFDLHSNQLGPVGLPKGARPSSRCGASYGHCNLRCAHFEFSPASSVVNRTQTPLFVLTLATGGGGLELSTLNHGYVTASVPLDDDDIFPVVRLTICIKFPYP